MTTVSNLWAINCLQFAKKNWKSEITADDILGFLDR